MIPRIDSLGNENADRKRKGVGCVYRPLKVISRTRRAFDDEHDGKSIYCVLSLILGRSHYVQEELFLFSSHCKCKC